MSLREAFHGQPETEPPQLRERAQQKAIALGILEDIFRGYEQPRQEYDGGDTLHSMTAYPPSGAYAIDTPWLVELTDGTQVKARKIETRSAVKRGLFRAPTYQYNLYGYSLVKEYEGGEKDFALLLPGMSANLTEKQNRIAYNKQFFSVDALLDMSQGDFLELDKGVVDLLSKIRAGMQARLTAPGAISISAQE